MSFAIEMISSDVNLPQHKVSKSSRPEIMIRERKKSLKLYSDYTLIVERLTNPEKELRGSATTAEDKGDRP